jgi:hypothetical protein
MNRTPMQHALMYFNPSRQFIPDNFLLVHGEFIVEDWMECFLKPKHLPDTELLYPKTSGLMIFSGTRDADLDVNHLDDIDDWYQGSWHRPTAEQLREITEGIGWDDGNYIP